MSGMFGESRQVPKHKSVEWYTPGWVFDALGVTFDLDPASPHDMETAVPAAMKYTVFDDGLKKPWTGRVWLNPPYGPNTEMWLKRMVNHGNGIAMVFSRTDAGWFQDAMRAATAMLFFSGRIEFVPGRENQHKKSRCGAGTVMLAFGAENAYALRKLSDRGVFIAGQKRRITHGHRRQWTPDEDNQLRGMYMQKTYREISIALGRSESSIASRVYTLMLPRRPARRTA